jgi:uncharacterized protein (TIGR00255 family)
MTAYGRGEYAEGTTVFTAEIKSVNHRYRDVVLRIPRSLQPIEDEIRSQVSSRIRRGRIEVLIQLERNGAEAEYNLDLNVPLVKAYLRIFSQLKEDFGIEREISLDSLCQMKDVIIVKPEEADIDETRAGLKEVLDRAIDSLDTMRIQEGRTIEKDFSARLVLIEGYLKEIEGRVHLVVEEYSKKLKERIKQLSQNTELDESRLIQEVAIFADRCDVTEEVLRMKSHLSQFNAYIGSEESVGRRLDFLIQEINREINTISSKVSDSSISAMAVEIKAELEKLREQAQNVE